jgi:hypothetical protein
MGDDGAYRLFLGISEGRGDYEDPGLHGDNIKIALKYVNIVGVWTGLI